MDYKKAYEGSLDRAKELWGIYKGERHIIEFILPEVCYLKDKEERLKDMTQECELYPDCGDCSGNSSQRVKCVWHSVDELPMFDRGENGDMTPPIVDSYYKRIGGVSHSYTRVMWRNHIDTHRNREFMWAYESDLFPINCKKPEPKSINDNIPYKESEVICVDCSYRWLAERPVTKPLKDIECPWCGKQGFVIETGETIKQLKR